MEIDKTNMGIIKARQLYITKLFYEILKIIIGSYKQQNHGV